MPCAFASFIAFSPSAMLHKGQGHDFLVVTCSFLAYSSTDLILDLLQSNRICTKQNQMKAFFLHVARYNFLDPVGFTSSYGFVFRL